MSWSHFSGDGSFIMCGSGMPDKDVLESAVAGLFNAAQQNKTHQQQMNDILKSKDPRLTDYVLLGGLAYEDLRLDFQRRTAMLFKIKRVLMAQGKDDWLAFKRGWNKAKRGE